MYYSFRLLPFVPRTPSKERVSIVPISITSRSLIVFAEPLAKQGQGFRSIAYLNIMQDCDNCYITLMCLMWRWFWTDPSFFLCDPNLDVWIIFWHFVWFKHHRGWIISAFKKNIFSAERVVFGMCCAICSILTFKQHWNLMVSFPCFVDFVFASSVAELVNFEEANKLSCWESYLHW